jgi:hypothetical protein
LNKGLYTAKDPEGSKRDINVPEDFYHITVKLLYYVLMRFKMVWTRIASENIQRIFHNGQQVTNHSALNPM